MRKISNEEFNEKYYMYKTTIYSIAYAYVHNVHDADDIVQDVFIKYLTSSETFKTLDNELFWLIRVTINTCKNFLATAWKRKVDLNDEIVNRIKSNQNNEGHPYDYLFEIVYQLPHKYKEVIVLYYFEDLPVKDISRILNISEAACKKRLERARNLIREKEQKYG